MREILFRGIRRAGNNMIFGNYHKGALTGTPFINGSEVNPETVGQFTGLLDKNGTKIFEGDILVNRLNRMVDKEPYQIIYDEYSGGWLWSNETGCDPFYQEIAKNGEVIGNIHDNPELLMEEL